MTAESVKSLRSLDMQVKYSDDDTPPLVIDPAKDDRLAVKTVATTGL